MQGMRPSRPCDWKSLPTIVTRQKDLRVSRWLDKAQRMAKKPSKDTSYELMT